ncbi:MAG: type II secretion system secretin GspD, partial [Nitrospinaceae bacterium]
MNRRILIPLLLSLFFLLACEPKNKDTLSQQPAIDPVEQMRLPKRPDGGAKTPEAQANGGDLIDPKSLSKLAKPALRKRVVLSGNQVPLRAGPGARFDVVGTGMKGDALTLLGTQADEGSGEFWYLAEDDNKNKVFIASPLATVTIDSGAPKDPGLPMREAVQTAREPSGRNLRTVFDPTPPLPRELRKAKHITLNFEGTELYDVITTFCELLKIDYLIEGSIQGKVTLQTFNKIPVTDLYSVLEQILALHNVAVVKSGNFYRFLPSKDATGKPLAMYYGQDSSVPARERLVVQIVPLKHVSVETMQKIVTPLLTKNGSFIEVPETKNLMMIEMAYNVRRILKVVSALDIDKLASSDIQLYRLHNADAEVVVEELTEIFSSMGYKDVLGESLTFLALSRLNSVLTVSSFQGLKSPIEFWVNKLDEPASEGKVSTFVYYVQNGDALQMADLVTTIFPQQEVRPTETGRTRESTAARRENQTTKGERNNGNGEKRESSRTAGQTGRQATVSGGVAEAIEGETTIIPDESTNSLIIRTNPRNYPPILELIHKLDLVPQQVLIEVLILDLILDDSMSRGIEWFFQSTTDGSNVGAFSTEAGTTLGQPIGEPGTFPQGGAFFVTHPDRVLAQLKLLASDSKTNVLANPILVTSDNKPANISIAEDVPFRSTSLTTTTNTTSRATQFRNVGIKLDITPKINSDNFVNLLINQEISSLADSSFQGTGNPSFLTRVINTEVVLKDNEVLIMGGLIRNQVTELHQGVPVLKDIPVLGELFGTRFRGNSKTELVVFIVPHIISNTGDAGFVTGQLKNRLGNLQRPTQPTAAP